MRLRRGLGFGFERCLGDGVAIQLSPACVEKSFSGHGKRGKYWVTGVRRL
jgi:hypothetical protein